MPALLEVAADGTIAITEAVPALVAATDPASAGAPVTGPLFLPLAHWLDVDSPRPTKALGPWVDAHEEVEGLGGNLSGIAAIAVHFPSFADGRGLSAAVLLRERYGYGGALYAFGDVRQDLLPYMRRCGFDHFELASQEHAQACAEVLAHPTSAYQRDALEPQPLFRRVARAQH